jgi:membrane-bound ClpP family serine protease
MAVHRFHLFTSNNHRSTVMMFWAFILLGLGLVVVVMELFLPSAGILGILATVLILSSIVLGFTEGLKYGALMLGLVVVSVPAVLALMVKVWPHTPLGKRILLKDLKPEDVLPNSSHYTRKKDLEGRLGVAKTKMLPSGIIVVDGEKFDAVSEEFAIEQGDPIKVVSVRENRIYVQRYDGEVEDTSELPPRDRDILSQPIEELGLDALDDPLGQ